MGASAYFKNDQIINKIRSIVKLKKNGLFELDLNFFNHYQFHRPKYYNDNLINLLGVEPGSKSNDNDLKKIYYEIANGAQTVFEEIYFHMLNHLKKFTKSENIVLGGGCALNCLANGKITKKTGFKNIFISPVPDDSGAGLGAAAYVYKNIINSKKKFNVENYFLGPSSDEKTILSKLKKYQIKYQKLKNVESHAAISISKGMVIGWFQGKIEFGDRALGNRSILADPRNKNMKTIVNEKIKYREKFRPFAPAVLEEEAYKYFDNLKNSKYMEIALMVKKNKIDLIPAVTHIDGTARLQTVTKKFNKKFYKLINEFYKLTNIPILLNTSFNIQGEPIVCSVEDALKNFYLSGLDILYLDNFVIKK
jgi:carbamoyltransferase